MIHLCKDCTPKDHIKDFDKTIWSTCEMCEMIGDCEILDPTGEIRNEEEDFQKDLRCTD